MVELDKNKVFVNEVKRLMKEQNINQKDLAKRSGITEASVSRYLAGTRLPRLDVVLNFAEALKVDPSILLPNEEKDRLSFDDLKIVLARNGKNLTDSERIELIKLLSGKEDNV